MSVTWSIWWVFPALPAPFADVDPMARKQFAGGIPGDVEGSAELPQISRQSRLMAGQGSLVQRGAGLDVDLQQFITPAVVQDCLSLENIEERPTAFAPMRFGAPAHLTRLGR